MPSPYGGLDSDDNWIPGDDNNWAAPGECERCGQAACICKPAPKQPYKTLSERLRETEREIARNPEQYGFASPDEFERIRQWPGEY